MNEEIKKELEKTNRLLEKHVKIQTRIFRMFYFRSFLSGVFSALGVLFATSVLAGLIVYYVSRLPFIKEIQPFIEQYSLQNTTTIEKNVQIEPDQP